MKWIAVLTILVLGCLVVMGCESADLAAARRAEAEAGAQRAAAEAYQQRQAADTQAAAERSAIRQAERDAALQRSMAWLPYVLTIMGGLLLAGFGTLIWWDLRRPVSPDPFTLLLLQGQQHKIAELERTLYRRISAEQRREVVVYPDRE